MTEPVQINQRYILKEKLGEGGMGAVYVAHDRLTNKPVAFKRVVAPSGPADDPITIQESMNLRLALAHEFQVLASLRHPHIIDVLDYGFDADKQPYFTMSLLESPTTLIEAGQGEPLKPQLELLSQLLQALWYLHRRGILHRDLKPANVLVNIDQVRVLDFGLASLRDQEESETLAGTMAYIAPEVLQGQSVTEASDLYAVGIMAYELFVGHHPYNLEDMGRLIEDILQNPPDFSDLEKTVSLEGFHGDIDETVLPTIQAENVGSHLVPWLERLLHKDPAQRFQSADEALRQLLIATAQPIPIETEAIRESFLQGASFTGRQQEIKMLRQALQDAVQGKGSSWLIGGESGVGKSRLLDELRIEALVQGMVVSRGQAIQEGGAPFVMWRTPIQRLALGGTLTDQEISVLRLVAPELPQILDRPHDATAEFDAQQGRDHLIGTVASLFRRQTQPQLLILEDLHWAEESLEVLKRVNQLVEDLPLVIVGSFRDDERPEMPTLLPEMKHLKLERLAQEETAALAASMIGVAAQKPEVVELLQQETEGNAFFLVEIIRVLAEEAGKLSDIGQVTLPESVIAGGVQQIIQRRLEGVPAFARPLLDLAAIMGRQLDLKVLEAVRQNSNLPYDLTDWLVLCSDAALLDVQEDKWRFAHNKMREGLIATLAADRLTMLHEQAGTTIEQVYADVQEHAVALAFHFGASGNVEKEHRYATIAGRQALDTSAFSDARRFLSRAIELERDPQQMRVLHYQLGEALRGLSEYAEAINHYEQARSHDDAQSDGLALLGMGRTNLDRGQHGDAVANLNEALLRLREARDQRNESITLYALSRAHQYMGKAQEANEFSRQALDIAREIGDRRSESLALFGLGFNHIPIGELDAARNYLREALEIDRELGNRRGEGFASMYLGVAFFFEGKFAEGIPHVERTLEIARDIGDRRLESLALVNLSSAYSDLGDLERSTEFALRTLSIVRSIGDRRTELYTGLNLAESYRKMGEFEQAVDYARQSLKLAQDTKDAYNGVWALGEVAMAQQVSGLLDKSLTNLEKAATLAESVESPDLTARINAFWARGLLLKNDMERASQVIETACAAGDPGMDFQVKVLRSLIMLRQGQGIQAGQAVDELLAQEGSAENGYHYALLVAIKAILGEDASSDSALDDVQAAYRRAIEAAKYKGLVRHAQQEFEALLMADNRFTLLPVKAYLDQVVSEF